jgi:two-component system, NtrC family, sensor kinase
MRGGSAGKHPAKGRRIRNKTGKVATKSPSIGARQRQIGGLTRKLKQALEFQTATGAVLRILANSPDNLQSVFDAVLEKAIELCEAKFGTFFLRDGDVLRLTAQLGCPPELERYLATHPIPLNQNSGAARAFSSRQAVHFPDVLAEPNYGLSEAQRVSGYRSLLAFPLLREQEAIGVFSLARTEPEPFSEQQIDLVRTFADQAVIAISNVNLFDQVQTRTRELTETLEYQTATSDVLNVISRSPNDLQPVMDTIVGTAHRLCESEYALIFHRVDQGAYEIVANANTSQVLLDWLQGNPITAGDGSAVGIALAEKRTVHLPDALEDARFTDKRRQEVSKARTMLVVPLMREVDVIGVIFLARNEVRPFTQKQIDLVTSFADQAVIAIENARLLTETREALKQQTATAEVLQVINSSPGDLAPVFRSMLEKAMRLCDAKFGILWTYDDDGERFFPTAQHGLPAAFAEFLCRPIELADSAALRDVAHARSFLHMTDLASARTHSESPLRRATVDLGGARTGLGVPLRKGDKLLGIFFIYRQEVRPFSDKQVALVQNFAAQAVIAIENARLLGELHERTADLARSVDELTATSDVLKIISRSTTDLETVLDTLVETVARLCRADQALIFRRRDDLNHLAAAHGVSGEARQFMVANPLPSDRGTLSGRVGLERRVVHIPDVMQDEEYTYWEAQKKQGQRTMLGVPLLRGDSLIGIFSITRTRVDPFTPKEIELATTFSDQAVIAIENARLFEELRERQAELRVTFDNMGDGVVMFGADTRLVAWNRNFQTILDLPDVFLAQRPSYADYFRYLAARGEYSADLEAELSRALGDMSREMRLERTRPDGRVIEVRRNPVPGGGFVLIYADITERKRAEQAIRVARDTAESALRQLQTAQASLVHAQKMAALGQLTAGIAHEIKNPLNFVNNFAALSSELTDELSDVLKPVALPGKVREEVKELTCTLKDNLGRVVQHGKRADSIVKNMLLHSREGSSERRPVGVNALVEESLNLAYHGARAEKQGFNIALERSFDPAAGEVDAFPQEITRVLLNLIANGIYAATKRQDQEGGDGFEPTIRAATKSLGDRVEIRIRDNGIGIAPEVQEKMFNPFFTTKPAGEGTGLGLSISHDIIVKQHSGSIVVDTEPGTFTEFKIILPRTAE